MRKQGQKIGAPFYALTIEEIKQWYLDKLITTSGYLLSIQRIETAPGKQFTIPDVLAFCAEWQISKASFYRAVNELTRKGYLDWEATKGVILKKAEKVVPVSATETSLKDKTQSQTWDSQSQTWDSQSQTWDSQSQTWDSQSQTWDSQSQTWDSQSQTWDSPIYNDHARIRDIRDLQRYTENTESVEEKSPTTPQEPVVFREDFEHETLHSIPSLENTKEPFLAQGMDSREVINLVPQVEVITNTKTSKMDELVSRLEQGELSDLPVNEKKQLANHLMRDRVVLYRKSGWILSVKSNDVNQEFLQYVAWKELKRPGDLDWARNTILAYERDMTKWGQLTALVDGWRSLTPEQIAATSSARVATREGSQEDLRIAIQSSLAASKNLDEKYSIFKKKA